MDDSKSDQQNALPPDAVKIGTINLGEKPRTPSFSSRVAMAVGYLTTYIGSGLAKDLVSDLAKEDVSAYKLEGKGFLSAFQKGLHRAVDLKLWKSNVALFVTWSCGIAVTGFAVRKIEEHTFAKKHGELPRMDQINQILAGDFQSSEQPKTNWQDKTKRSEEVQQSVSI